MSAEVAQRTAEEENESNQKKAELLNWVHPDESPEDALTARQLVELKKGVRAAIEEDDSILSAPGDLHSDHWNHAGVGVSIWMHRSGVVVMTCEGDSIVTDADTLDNISTAKAAFFADPGMAAVSSEDV